jgi:tetratricopeptide (TPR) repeat protein
VAALAAGVTAAGGVLGAREPAGPPANPSPAAAEDHEGPVERAQRRLRLVPGDWRTWAALGMAYLDRGRGTGDPTLFPKAREAVDRSLALRPKENPEGLVARGALANARHDFAAARADARAAIRLNAYDADAYAVLADAETQLGNASAATTAVQRLLDLRPGLPAYARASYDLEQRGRAAEATDLMRRALDTAVDPMDQGFCRLQLGDLAWQAGDLATAGRQYAAGLAVDPSSVALQRGRARVAAAHGRVDAALADYADLTSRVPIPGYLLEYAELLHAAGRPREAAAQLELAATAHQLFAANGGADDLTAAALASAAVTLGAGDRAAQAKAAVTAARAEWSRRRHADVADALGWALHLTGRDAEAIGYARRAAKVDAGSGDAAYAYHLAAIELALGERAAAREHFMAALTRNPHFSPVDAPAARRALTSLGGAR